MTTKDWKDLDLLRVPPNSPSQLKRCRSILIDVLNFATSATESETMWRGHTSSDHRLTPSIARSSAGTLSKAAVKTRTEALLDDAISASHDWRDGAAFRAMPELEKLALIQHRITGTPLLDVTPDPFIALWMACNESRTAGASPDGLLIGFNNFNDKWTNLTASNVSWSDAVADAAKAKKLAWFRPTATSDRAVVQRSRFLVAPIAGPTGWYKALSDVVITKLPAKWDGAKLDGVFNPSVGKPAHVPIVGILVPASIKPTMRQILARNFGIERNTVYPDIEALRV